MKDYSNDPEFLDLIAAVHENRVFSEERMQQLSRRLEADPKLRRALAAEVQMAALTRTVQRGETRWLELEEILGDRDDSVPGDRETFEASVMDRVGVPSRNRRPLSPAWWLGISAAAAVLVLGGAIFLHGRMNSIPRPEVNSVARIIRIDGELRSSRERTVSIDERVEAGEKLTMSDGMVEMAFLETGVHVLATAPLSLTADSRNRIFVHDGEVKLHVPPQGVGFVVETTERKITDLGTSFVVTARAEGSRVLVLDGQIAIDDRKGGSGNLMHEGDLADFDRSGVTRLRSRGPSGVPELTLPPMELTASSLPGKLFAFKSPPGKFEPGVDVIGARFLPLIRSGFRDESDLADLRQVHSIRFTGIAGTYDGFPGAAGLDTYEIRTGWMAWYRGSVVPPQPGKYRFWGYADNHLLVAVNGKPVFEGSRYSSALREKQNVPRRDHPSLPCLNSTAGFASGEWFEVKREPVRMNILFGEQGANMTSGLLLIECAGDTYEETFWGQPKWPLFLAEPPAEPEIAELENLRNHMEQKLMGSFSMDASAIWKVAGN